MNKESKSEKPHPRTIYQISSPPPFAAINTKTDSITYHQHTNDHTKRHIPSIATNIHASIRTHTRVHACTRVQAHARVRTHSHTNTHTYTHAHEYKNKRSAHSLPTTSAQTHKSQVNFKRFSISPTDTNYQHRYTSFIGYHRC